MTALTARPGRSRVGQSAPVLSYRVSLLVAHVVGLALIVVTLQALLTLWQQPMQHGAWRTGAVAVVMVGVWLLVNSPVEGPVLLSLTPSHGLTLADVMGLPALVAGAAVLVQVARL